METRTGQARFTGEELGQGLEADPFDRHGAAVGTVVTRSPICSASTVGFRPRGVAIRVPGAKQKMKVLSEVLTGPEFRLDEFRKNVRSASAIDDRIATRRDSDELDEVRWSVTDCVSGHLPAVWPSGASINLP